MGLYFSQQHEPAKEKSLEFTPSQQLRGKRILAIDPRSPSDFYSRTPIIVNETPDILVRKLVRPLTDDTSPVIKDPRSPTTEFTRTPINPCNPSPAAIRQRVVTAQTVCIQEVPNTKESKSESVSDRSQVPSYRNLLDQPTTSLESLESAICLDKRHELCCEDKSPDTDVNSSDFYPSPSDIHVEGHEDDEGYEDMDVSPQMLENRVLNKVKSTEENTPKLPAISRSVVLKPKMLVLTPGNIRSPLATVQNSPRVLSQMNIKQAQGDKHSLITNMRMDKENIRH